MALFVFGACGGDGGGADSDDAGDNCDQIVDRWVEIQQQLLDDLDDAEDRDLSDDAVAALSAGTASGLFENSRDATRLGCEDVLMAGSAALCDRVSELQAPGPASTAALADLQTQCAS
ncbi:MAG: hypothetical protein ACR2PK_11280 [Acidimicrobiales bacterium]